MVPCNLYPEGWDLQGMRSDMDGAMGLLKPFHARKVVAAVCGFVLFQLASTPHFAQAKEEAPPKYVWARAAFVVIHSGPGGKYAETGKVPRGTRMTVTETDAGYYHVVPPSYDLRTLPDQQLRKSPTLFQPGWTKTSHVSATEIFDEATALQIFEDWIDSLQRDPFFSEGAFKNVRLVPLAAVWSEKDNLEFSLGVAFQGEMQISTLGGLGRWIYLMLGQRFFGVFKEAQGVELRLIARVWGVGSDGVVGSRYEPMVRIRTNETDARHISWEKHLVSSEQGTDFFTEYWEHEQATLTTR